MKIIISLKAVGEESFSIAIEKRGIPTMMIKKIVMMILLKSSKKQLIKSLINSLIEQKKDSQINLSENSKNY